MTKITTISLGHHLYPNGQPFWTAIVDDVPLRCFAGDVLEFDSPAEVQEAIQDHLETTGIWPITE